MLCNQWDSKHIYLLAKYPTGYKLVFLMPISVVYFYAYYFVSPLLQNVSLFVSFTAVGWGSTSDASGWQDKWKVPLKVPAKETKRSVRESAWQSVGQCCPWPHGGELLLLDLTSLRWLTVCLWCGKEQHNPLLPPQINYFSIPVWFLPSLPPSYYNLRSDLVAHLPCYIPAPS